MLHFISIQPYNNHDYRYSENTQNRFGQPVSYHDSFHTYAVEWDAKKIRYYIDDVNWYTLYDADVNGTISQNAPMETVLNVAVGGDFLGGSGEQPDGSSVWPQQMLVDYVRVFERDNNVPITMSNGDFEANQGGLAGWSTFGNAPYTNNVSIHNEAAHGDASLKLFGQFTGGRNESGVSQGISVAAGDEVHADVSRFIRSQDSISGTGNVVNMRIEFFNDFGGKVDTSAMLQTDRLDDCQRLVSQRHLGRFRHDRGRASQRSRSSVVVHIFAIRQRTGGAVHLDDVSFLNLSLAAAADFNLDGKVDAEDLAMWQTELRHDDWCRT